MSEAFHCRLKGPVLVDKRTLVELQGFQAVSGRGGQPGGFHCGCSGPSRAGRPRAHARPAEARGGVRGGEGQAHPPLWRSLGPRSVPRGLGGCRCTG